MGSFRRLLNNKKSIKEPFASYRYGHYILMGFLRDEYPMIANFLVILGIIIMIIFAYILFNQNKHTDTIMTNTETVQAELYTPLQYQYNQPYQYNQQYSQYPYNQQY